MKQLLLLSLALFLFSCENDSNGNKEANFENITAEFSADMSGDIDVLEISDDDKAKLKELVDALRADLENLRNSDLSREEKRDAHKLLLDNFNLELDANFDSETIEKFNALREKHGGKKRHQGIKGLLDQLDLSDSQTALLDSQLIPLHDQLKIDLDAADSMEAKKAVHEAHKLAVDSILDGILTDDQKAKLEELKAKGPRRGKPRKGRRGRK